MMTSRPLVLRVYYVVILLLLAVIIAVNAAPVLLEPDDGATDINPFPHFAWESDAGCEPDALNTDCSYVIQISQQGLSDVSLVDEDVLPAVITRYVPDKQLPVAQYSWRVGVVYQAAAPQWSNMRTFGIVPAKESFIVPADADFNTTVAIIAKAASATPAKVTFESGDRRLNPSNSSAFISLVNVTDLIIDGGNSTVVFTWYLTYFSFLNCKNIIMMNFHFDMDPLPYSAMEIVSVDETLGTFVGQLAPGHPTLEELPDVDSAGIGGLMNKTTKRTKRGAAEVLTFTNWTRTSTTFLPTSMNNTAGSVFYKFDTKNLITAAVGDIFFVDPRISVGFEIEHSDSIVFSEIVAYAISNEGYQSIHTSRHSMLHCGIHLLPGRYLAANNGGHNHHSMRQYGLWLEGGFWENAGDDMLNINQLVITVPVKYNSTSVQIKPVNYDYPARQFGLGVDVGDHITFFDRASGTIVSSRMVVNIVNGQNGAADVIFDGDVGDITPGSPTKKGPLCTVAYNLNATAQQVVLRNNKLFNARRIGFLVHGHRGLIENNYFEGLGGGMTEGWPDPVEGLATVSYVIRNNTAVNVNQLDRIAAPIWFQSFRSGGSRIHRDLLVANNTISSGPGPTFLIQDSADFLITGNHLTRCASDSSPPISTNNTINIDFANDNIVTKENTFELCESKVTTA